MTKPPLADQVAAILAACPPGSVLVGVRLVATSTGPIAAPVTAPAAAPDGGIDDGRLDQLDRGAP